MTNIRDLHQLLLELFSSAELRRFIHFGPEGDELVKLVSFDGDAAEVAYQCAMLLERRGLVDQALFRRLEQKVPGQRARIAAVARRLLGSLTTVHSGTHLLTLAAPIGGQLSLISPPEIKAALGDRAVHSELRIDLNDLDVTAGSHTTWQIGQDRIRSQVQTYLRDVVARSTEPRVSVFGLAPIPWLMALGYALSETVPSRLFNRLRVPPSWSWEAGDFTSGWASRRCGDPIAARDVALLVSASATVRPARVDHVLPPESRATYELTLAHPQLDAIRSERQLDEFGRAYRDVLDTIEREVEGVERIHIFAAVPVALAIDCGRRILHTASPELVTYQFVNGAYERALSLGSCRTPGR